MPSASAVMVAGSGTASARVVATIKLSAVKVPMPFPLASDCRKAKELKTNGVATTSAAEAEPTPRTSTVELACVAASVLKTTR